jgi:stage III sporulation protein AG
MSQKEKTPLTWGRRLLLGGIALLGVALLLIGSLPTIGQDKGELHARSAAQEKTEQREEQAYAEILAEQIEALCVAACGSDDVYAVVSLQDGYAYRYATDSELRTGQENEQSSQSYVTVGSGSNQSPVLIASTPPQIAGIGVVCRGGDCSRNELVSLLSAAFGVGANRIYVVMQ